MLHRDPSLLEIIVERKGKVKSSSHPHSGRVRILTKVANPQGELTNLWNPLGLSISYTKRSCGDNHPWHPSSRSPVILCHFCLVLPLLEGSISGGSSRI